VPFGLARCGVGPRGFYYNHGSHDGDSAFAIDFTRYRRGLPFVNASEGTPVLAVQMGSVTRVVSNIRSGSRANPNLVEIHHVWARGRIATEPFVQETSPLEFFFEPYTSRYLHLAGPMLIPVSVGMFVRQGARLGLMDDTGESFLNHLHFSLHDGRRPGRRFAFGRSVRPSPMGRTRLEDRDEGKCVRSRNVPFP
jgi:murein DD-endopeptidase MepM/ murein hydrolase activator NlpD